MGGGPVVRNHSQNEDPEEERVTEVIHPTRTEAANNTPKNHPSTSSKVAGQNVMETDNDGPIKAKTPVTSESWKAAEVIKPYGGELNPKGVLHSALGFAAIFSNNYEEGTIRNIPKPENPANQLRKIMAPKLQELSELRRFKLSNFCDDEPLMLIGRGGFGEVHKRKFLGSEVAVKTFIECDPLDIFREVHTLIFLQHKRVVKVLGAFYENMMTYLVMELCEGNLRHHASLLSRAQIVRFSIQLLQGIEFIHSKNIIHCDIKPDNCFITQRNNIVIGDFGNAQLLPKDTEFIKTEDEEIFLSSKMYSDVYANQGIYSKASDIFGIGCTIFEMDGGEPLMEYITWRKAPVEEYINVAKFGRLLLFPPEYVYHDPLEVTDKWNLDGPREPLSDRVKRFAQFPDLVWDMVKDGHRRLGAQELLDKYHAFFDEKLSNAGSSRDKLDTDSAPENVKLRARNTQTRAITPSPVTKRLATLMDLIYYDNNLDISTLKSGPVKEPKTSFSADCMDELRNSMNQLSTKSSNQVEQKGSELTNDSSHTSTNPAIMTKTFELPMDVVNAAIQASALRTLDHVNNSSEGASNELNVDRTSDKSKPPNIVRELQQLKPSSSTLAFGMESLGATRKPMSINIPSTSSLQGQVASQEGSLIRKYRITIKPQPSQPSSNAFVTSFTPRKVGNLDNATDSTLKRVLFPVNDVDDELALPYLKKIRKEGDTSVRKKNVVKQQICSGPAAAKSGPRKRGNKNKATMTTNDQTVKEKVGISSASKKKSSVVRLNKRLKDLNLKEPSKGKTKNSNQNEASHDIKDKAEDSCHRVKKSLTSRYGGIGIVAMEDRGKPARPKNVPAHIKAKLPRGWRGWFDCACKAFYNVDYIVWKAHEKTCSVAKRIKNRTGKN